MCLHDNVTTMQDAVITFYRCVVEIKMKTYMYMLTGAAASVSPSQDGLQLKVCFQVMPVLFSLYNSIQMLGCKSELWVG